MSYYLPELFNAISDRLRGDSGAGGLTTIATGGVYLFEAPAAQSAPYVVIRLVTAPPAGSEGFRLRSRQVVIDVDVYAPSHASGTANLTKMANILDRIEGNWDEVATQASPQYGLDRWTPSISSTGWTCTCMEYIDASVNNEPGVYHTTLTFQVYAQKAGATS